MHSTHLEVRCEAFVQNVVVWIVLLQNSTQRCWMKTVFSHKEYMGIILKILDMSL